jgi:hypothetical protein
MIQDGYVHAAKQDSRESRTEARSDILATGRPALLRIGRISAVQGGGSYGVEIIDDQGGIAGTMDHVFVVPTTSQSVGNIVWVVTWPGNPISIIIGGTGEGGDDEDGGYFMSYQDQGYYGMPR